MKNEYIYNESYFYNYQLSILFLSNLPNVRRLGLLSGKPKLKRFSSRQSVGEEGHLSLLLRNLLVTALNPDYKVCVK